MRTRLLALVTALPLLAGAPAAAGSAGPATPTAASYPSMVVAFHL